MDNQEIGRRIKKARELKNLTLEAIASEVGVARSTIQRYENGKIDKIKLPVIESIAKALSVSPAWLSCKTDDMTQGIISTSITNVFPVELKRFPMLGEIACGEPRYANEDRESYVLAGANIKADFCLKAKGDSMVNARICDGDIVFIRKQDIVENGEIAAVVVNGESEATLKRFYYNREKALMILKPENSNYRDQIYTGEELNQVHIIGKAIAFQSDVK